MYAILPKKALTKINIKWRPTGANGETHEWFKHQKAQIQQKSLQTKNAAITEKRSKNLQSTKKSKQKCCDHRPNASTTLNTNKRESSANIKRNCARQGRGPWFPGTVWTWDNPNRTMWYFILKPEMESCANSHDVLQMHIPPRCGDPTYHNRDPFGWHT